MRCGVSSDQEVSEYPPRAQITMLSPPFRVASEGPSGRSPNLFTQFPINRNSRVFEESIHEILNLFTQFPINRNSRVFEESIHEIFSSSRASYQFGENRSGHGKISVAKS